MTYTDFAPSVLPDFGCDVRGIERFLCVWVFFVWKRFKSKNGGFEISFQEKTGH